MSFTTSVPMVQSRFLGVSQCRCSLRLTSSRVRTRAITCRRSVFITDGPCRPQATRIRRQLTDMSQPKKRKDAKGNEPAFASFAFFAPLREKTLQARYCIPGSVSSCKKSPISIARRLSFLYKVCLDPNPSASLAFATLQSCFFSISVITRRS